MSEFVRHSSAGAVTNPVTIAQFLQGSDQEIESVLQKDNSNYATSAHNQKSLRQKSISAFDRILNDNAGGKNDQVNMSVNRSIQKSRKNRVILPKIMFFNQSTYAKDEREASGRLISLDRFSTLDPNANNSIDMRSNDGSIVNSSLQ